MKLKSIIATIALLVLSACAVTGNVFGPTPEAQIVTGASAVTAAAKIANDLLLKDRITVAQAKSYSAILHTAGGHLDAAHATLIACRSKTGSTSAAKPDPCAPGIMSDIQLAVQVVGEVKKTLDAKQ